MIHHPLIMFVLLPLAAYVIGATPFAFIIARGKGIDLRKVGSGNIGATNCGRACGWQWGYLCFALDVAKGLLPVVIVGMMLRPEWPCDEALIVKLGGQPRVWVPSAIQQAAWLLTGCCAIMGHICTFWLRFRGGKGVATALGVVLGIWPIFTFAGVIALGVWIIVTLISRYVSLGSIVAALAFLAVCAAQTWRRTELWPMATFAAAMAGLIIFRHRTNISRILAGTENKIGSPKRSAG
jgi:glycerol-3-phosphate acyltransferase PlsY